MTTPHNTGKCADLQSTLAEIDQQLRSLRFGSLEVVIHEGRAVHIERRESLRFASPPTSNPASLNPATAG